MQSNSADPRLLLFMLVMLIAGATNVLLKDFMVNVQVPTGPDGAMSDFQRPLMWSFLMKAGMALCLPFHFAWPEAPMWVFTLSCSLGFVTDVLVNMAYCAIAGSAIQMLRGGKVVLTALLSIALLRRRLQLHQFVGGAIVVLGISLVGLSTSNRALQEPPTLANMPWKAIGFCILGEVTQSFLWVYQESCLKKWDIPPLQLVGLEGTIGVVLGGLALIIAHSLEIENLWVSLHQLGHSTPLLITVASLLVSMAFFNFAGVGVTKLGSAIHRSIIDVSRSVIIWAFEIFLGWHVFTIWQFAGFAILVCGALIYNHILVIPTLERVEEKPILETKHATP